MEVLMIGPGNPNPQNSGLGIACYHIAQHLAKNVHLKLFSVESAEELADQELESSRTETLNRQKLTNKKQLNADLVHLSVKSKLNPYFYSSSVEIEQEYNESIALSVQEALEEFSQKIISKSRNLDFDIIYAHDWTAIPASKKLKELSNKPFVLHIHALDYDRSGKKSNSWLFDLEKEGMQIADLVIAVSEYHKKIMVKEYGIKASKIKVIHHGLDKLQASDYKAPFDEDIILFCGRLSLQKGATTFIDIAEALLKKDQNLRFVVTGQGELMEEMIATSTEKAIWDKIHFTGHLPQEDVFAIMKAAQVMVMPSLSEPFGLSALEAASLELPLVLSQNCGVAEVLKDTPTVAKQDIDGYVTAIREILSNKKQSLKIAKQNAESVHKRNWKSVSEDIFSALKQELKNG
ncbi:glycosyl transferase [Marivirga tractuosa]|uniref:Glycosyl transferase group 1 n=1 Tax=Marivirga tractuosa (strain ATCC 23168 / DSM 4126 / NBRC 15989 / NCIMB 1408 / VKM B-1430 / H-43) TaxID=643867 RepID=E4TP10_MARTH|nr:glycosyltransferase family 4 protein [Marivirga tractuosa]ADR23544.1 glycosyl transferase group 1 [Marivirga tractuosa DSM 4126]BDD15777.1 glycosyl transferase [Marivirga tractuosa]